MYTSLAERRRRRRALRFVAVSAVVLASALALPVGRRIFRDAADETAQKFLDGDREGGAEALLRSAKEAVR